ncbi:DUF3108 domain-containing protein [Xanthobacter sp. KR7-65]|uniref:DUF3108 domain-containing protein n=1 Tax=Xanthobacter sp. KR7-65 TaxID=3156612 RepID=UPI0032B5A3C3
MAPSSTTARSTFFCISAALAALALPALGGAARADGKLNARYTLTVGGVELGRGSITVEAGDQAYEISGSARVTGVLRAVSSGKGVAAARGALANGRMVPRIYAMNAEADGKAETARLAMTGGALKEMNVEPPLKPAPDRVPIEASVLQNIMDPMSGAFVYVPGTADLLSAAACSRPIPVFDGRQRYDLSLSYLRTEKVKAEGYAGPAVVCGVRYAPVAGHRPSRYTVKYMMENKDIYVWLVPIAGTRLMAPFRVSVATMIGTAILEASAFETEAKAGTVPVSAPRP